MIKYILIVLTGLLLLCIMNVVRADVGDVCINYSEMMSACTQLCRFKGMERTGFDFTGEVNINLMTGTKRCICEKAKKKDTDKGN